MSETIHERWLRSLTSRHADDIDAAPEAAEDAESSTERILDLEAEVGDLEPMVAALEDTVAVLEAEVARLRKSRDMWMAKAIGYERGGPDLVAALITIMDADEAAFQVARVAVAEMVKALTPTAVHDGD